MSDDDGINARQIEKLAYGGEALNYNAPRSFAAPSGPAASSQYLARWMPEDGGKAVIVGDWYEVLTAATLFLEMGANKIQIEIVREMPPDEP